MHAINLLSESAPHGPDLTWLLWVVLIVFVIIVIVGWITSRNKEEAPAEEAHAAHDDHAETASAAKVADDLKKLEGVGPKVAGVLAEVGYTTYAELAAADADEVRTALKSAGLHMMDPAGWIEQADLAAKGDMEALEKLQDELKGGRRA